MQRFCLALIFLTSSFLSVGQDVLRSVKLAVFGNQKDLLRSKSEIDKVVNDPQNGGNASMWYYKGLIYQSLSKDKVAKDLCADCRLDAFIALQKYVSLDPGMKELKIDSNAVLYDIYYSYYAAASEAYNRKDYPNALATFKKALTVEEYIYSNQLTGPVNFAVNAFDTTLIVYAGFAASQVPNDADMLYYYGRVISTGTANPNYLEIYQNVAEYYRNNGDKAKWAAAVQKGKKAFPFEDYWYKAELDLLPEKSAPAAVFAVYEQQVNERPSSFFITYNYAVELFKYVYNSSKDFPDREQQRARLTTILQLCVAADNGTEANVLMAKHLAYYADDIKTVMTSLKGSTPEDINKRNELNAQVAAKEDASALFANKSVAYYSNLQPVTLTARQKINYKDMLEVLSRYHRGKGDEAKAAEYKRRQEGLDKL